jgi:hypothetical protein
MKPVECPRDDELLRAVLTHRVDDEMRGHAETCEVCGDILTIASALRAERDDTIRDVHVPAAGQVWWRSALRAHAEAGQAARRPIVWLQGIVAACIAGMSAAVVGFAWPSLRDAAIYIAAFGSWLGPDVTPVVDAVRSAMPLVIAVIACLVLAPLAVYFALSDE